jgi:hypothetical protein
MSRGREKNRDVVKPFASPRVGANVEAILNEWRGVYVQKFKRLSCRDDRSCTCLRSGCGNVQWERYAWQNILSVTARSLSGSGLVLDDKCKKSLFAGESQLYSSKDMFCNEQCVIEGKSGLLHQVSTGRVVIDLQNISKVVVFLPTNSPR